ncbi:MAG: tRNA (adenosine(37)-N6)-dimethylallyltransferase MiaA, partial [Clostridia bacterium]|nr:tRNA (adenosine(37)-N6)-dimethylallyltransferase MiaA [Clostridia bacterium]
LEDEVKNLLEAGVKKDCQAMQGIGYKEVISYLNGEINFEECVELIKKRTRNYAKRQITFLNSFKNVINIAAGEGADKQIIKYLKENGYAN